MFPYGITFYGVGVHWDAHFQLIGKALAQISKHICIDIAGLVTQTAL